MGKILDEKHKQILLEGARNNQLILAVPCPGNCKFCYEKSLNKTFRNVVTEVIPKYTKESFDFLLQHLSDKLSLLSPSSGFVFARQKIRQRGGADFFHLGLTKEQIIKVMELNKKRYVRGQMYIYTTGFKVDPFFVKELSEKYAQFVEICLSAVTFNEKIKRELMTNYGKNEVLKRIIKHVRKLTVVLFHFNKEQTLLDLREINHLKPRGADVIIVKLYYSKFDELLVKKYAEKSYMDVKETVLFIYKNRNLFENINRIFLTPDSKIYAWTFQHKLRDILSKYDFRNNEFMFCSEGAYSELRKILKGKKVRVIPIKSPCGGSIDDAATITTNEIISKIKELKLQNIKISKLYLPSSMYWIHDISYRDTDIYDLRGKTKGEIKRLFPNIVLEMIALGDLGEGPLDLEDCYKYYLYEHN